MLLSRIFEQTLSDYFEQTLSDYFSLTFIYTNDTILRLAQREIVQ